MGIGPWHLFALIIIVLVFFGPSRLPTLGKSMGEAIRGFKKGLDGNNDEIDVTNSTQQRRENLHASQEQNAQTQQQREKNRADS